MWLVLDLGLKGHDEEGVDESRGHRTRRKREGEDLRSQSTVSKNSISDLGSIDDLGPQELDVQ